MFKLEISLKRVQTFIFEVPRLRAMLGANALIGQTMRYELPRLLGNKGLRLDWPSGIASLYDEDPLDKTDDLDNADNPAALYERGILARDGGHFIAVFKDDADAKGFLREAEEKLAELLPGVLYDARLEPGEPEKIGPRETQLLDLPVLQVCQETGRGPASDKEGDDWQECSVNHREKWGDRFYAERSEDEEGTKDIIGLLRRELYPDGDNNWHRPHDLAQLAAGSYLALIHTDGNGIGKRYKEWKDKALPGLDELGKEAHGEAFFHSMRVAVRRALVKALKETFAEATETDPKAKTPRPYEVLMLGGDDLLLICRADKALPFASTYAAELEKYKLADTTDGEEGHPLHVAIGVAIAQKTYPLHRLNELAESLASSAKRLYRALPESEKASVIDWQVVTQSWFEGVADARKASECLAYTVNGDTETLLLTARPCRVAGEDGLDGLLAAAKKLDGTGGDKAARSPLRSLRTTCERGRLMGEMAFTRLPKEVRAALAWDKDKGGLWRTFDRTKAEESKPEGRDSIHITRAFDIIGIWEIARLGGRKHD